MGQADAPSLVTPEVEDDADAGLRHPFQRPLQLEAAVAAKGPEDVAGEALGVDPHEDVLLALHRPPDQGHVLVAVEQGLVDVAGELAPLGGDGGLGHPLDQLLRLAPVADEVGDADEEQSVGGDEGLQLGEAGHRRLVLGDHLAQHPRRVEAGHAGQVDGGLGVATPLEHASLPVAETQRQ